MKKNIFLLCAILLTSLAMQAQPDMEKGRTVTKKTKDKNKDVPKFTFGLRAGGSLTSFYAQDFATVLRTGAQGNNSAFSDFAQKALLKPSAGISLTFNFNRYIAFTPEAMLSIFGEENTYKVQFTTPTQSVVLQNIQSVTEINYLQIPLLFQFSFGKGFIRPYLKAGGTPAYMLKATRKDLTTEQQTTATGTVTTSNSSAEQNLIEQSNVSPLQGGATLAAGIHLGRFFDIESRYDFNLSTLSDKTNSFYKDARSQALGVNIGVKF